jgi:hypothetical protein
VELADGCGVTGTREVSVGDALRSLERLLLRRGGDIFLYLCAAAMWSRRWHEARERYSMQSRIDPGVQLHIWLTELPTTLIYGILSSRAVVSEPPTHDHRAAVKPQPTAQGPDPTRRASIMSFLSAQRTSQDTVPSRPSHSRSRSGPPSWPESTKICYPEIHGKRPSHQR